MRGHKSSLTYRCVQEDQGSGRSAQNEIGTPVPVDVCNECAGVDSRYRQCECRREHASPEIDEHIELVSDRSDIDAAVPAEVAERTRELQVRRARGIWPGFG